MKLMTPPFKAIGLLFVLCFFNSPPCTQAQSFVRNIGQVTSQNMEPRYDIDYKLSATKGLNIFIGKGVISYQFAKETADSGMYEMYRMDVTLLGANKNATAFEKLPESSYERYYTLGLNGTVAPKMKEIVYRDIYPHIDLAFYFTDKGQLEYDFILHEGGNISNIALQYAGTNEMTLKADGALVVKTPLGTITENAPFAYQQKDKRKVQAKFELQHNIVSFAVEQYNGTLIIDPILEWATYFGGIEYDAIMDMTVAKDGMIYAAGNTNSLSNIATTGAFQVTFAGGFTPTGADAFLAKFDTTGNLLWSTYYGGDNVDHGTGVTSDTSGYIYMAGKSNSPQNIATPGVHQEIKAGTAAGYDAYIAKFDTSGTRIWGTYFGGTSAEGTNTIVLTSDRFNNLYLAGNTASTNGIATPGTHQQSRSGTSDGFLAKFSINGQLDWATYIGGSSVDAINDLNADGHGNIFVIGNTNSIDGIATPGTHQTAYAGGTDAFVMKFNSSGTRLWGTYFGGSSSEVGYGIVTDTFGNLYIGGSTASISGISVTTAHQAIYGGGSMDMFFSNLDANTGAMKWSTYYGGSGNDLMAKPLLDKNGKVLLTGTSTSPNNMTTPDAIMPNHSGDGKLIVAIFDSTGRREWGTYLGGNLTELNTAGILVGDNELFLAGYTNSSLGLSTMGAFQPIFGGNFDGYLMKVNLCFQPQQPDSILGPLEICANTPTTFHIESVPNAERYRWILPTGWIGSSDSLILETIATNSGTIKIIAINNCGHSDTTTIPIHVLPAPQPVISRSGNVLRADQSFTAYQWNKDGQPIQGAILPTYVVSSNGSYTLTVTAMNGCKNNSDPIEINHLSITKTNNAKVEVYPNPANEKIWVILDFTAEFELFDPAGRKILSEIVIKGTHSISLEHLNSGMYFLRLRNTANGEVFETKIIKAE